MNSSVNGILLIYHHHLSANAPTIMEHVESFGRYSQFKVWNVNTEFGFPYGLKNLEFSSIVLHYSLFGSYPFSLPEKFCQYVESSKLSVKIAFFQDEYQYCKQRFDLINRLSIDLIYTLLEPQYFDEVYYRHTNVKRVLPTLAGYVSNSLIDKATRFFRPFEEREVDVGYRARRLPFYMGRGAQEKTDIASGFVKHCVNHLLRLDIKTDESNRIYGEDWYYFVGNCKFMLGTEAGVSLFDFDGQIKQKCNELTRMDPDICFNELEKRLLSKIDGNINYRMISPRIFEAAALGAVPLLFSGHYNGLISAGSNYIEIDRNFSNIECVLNQLKDNSVIKTILQNNKSLVESYEVSYENFISSFDEEILEYLSLHRLQKRYVNEGEVDKLLMKGQLFRKLVALLTYIRKTRFPGKNLMKSILRKKAL